MYQLPAWLARRNPSPQGIISTYLYIISIYQVKMYQLPDWLARRNPSPQGIISTYLSILYLSIRWRCISYLPGWPGGIPLPRVLYLPIYLYYIYLSGEDVSATCLVGQEEPLSLGYYIYLSLYYIYLSGEDVSATCLVGQEEPLSPGCCKSYVQVRSLRLFSLS